VEEEEEKEEERVFTVFCNKMDEKD